MSGTGSVYNYIFFTNVLRLLDEQRMTKSELAIRSGVSISFLSELTAGKANPSLKVMEAIAIALATPLSFLLESTDMNKAVLNELAGRSMPSCFPSGFEWVCAVLPEHRAFLVKKWDAETRKRLKGL